MNDTREQKLREAANHLINAHASWIVIAKCENPACSAAAALLNEVDPYPQPSQPAGDHEWTGCRLGGSPVDAELTEWVRYCKNCGIEDTCEDPLPPCVPPKPSNLWTQFSDLAVEMEKHSNDHLRDGDPSERLGAAVEGVCADRIKAILREHPERASVRAQPSINEPTTPDSGLLMERMMDLVRYARSYLHNENLISDDEYAELLQVDDAVGRLEGYDKAISQARNKALEEVKSVLGTCDSDGKITQQANDAFERLDRIIERLKERRP